MSCGFVCLRDAENIDNVVPLSRAHAEHDIILKLIALSFEPVDHRFKQHSLARMNRWKNGMQD